MTVPAWALTLSYWLHMLATVVWLGGLAAVVLLITPAARQVKDLEQQAALLENAQRRLEPIGWFSLALLTGTGLIQMSANPQYQGFLAVTNQWAIAIFIKHLVFFGMTGISAYLTWFSLPELRRMTIKHLMGKDIPALSALQRRNLFLLRLNLILGVIVLAMTALARASV